MTRTGEHGTHGREHEDVFEDARRTGGRYWRIMSSVKTDCGSVIEVTPSPASFSWKYWSARERRDGKCRYFLLFSGNNMQVEKPNVSIDSVVVNSSPCWRSFPGVQERLIPTIEQSFFYLPLPGSLAAPKAFCFGHLGHVKRLQLELRRRGWNSNKEQRKASRARTITPETRAALEALGCSTSLQWIPALDTYLVSLLCTNEKVYLGLKTQLKLSSFNQCCIWLWIRDRKANENVQMWHQYTSSFSCKARSPSQRSNFPLVQE